jgi:uncharacterized membrane protein YidH (DUF202 family)
MTTPAPAPPSSPRTVPAGLQWLCVALVLVATGIVLRVFADDTEKSMGEGYYPFKTLLTYLGATAVVGGLLSALIGAAQLLWSRRR